MTEFKRRIEENRSDPHSVFICYTWDNLDHKRWVKDLAYSLRLNGCSVVLDQDEETEDSLLPVTIGMGCNTIIIIMTSLLYDRSCAGAISGDSFPDGWFFDEFQLLKLNFAKIGKVCVVLRSGDRCFFDFPIFDFTVNNDIHKAMLSLILFIRGYNKPKGYFPNPVFGTVKKRGEEILGWMSPLHEYEGKNSLSNIIFTSFASVMENPKEQYQVGKREHPHEPTF